MAELKTKENDASVKEFINSLKDKEKIDQTLKILKVFKEATGKKPKMWGSSIIGFGSYHYKSQRSKQEGDWMLTGFSPRKKAFSLYIMSGFNHHKDILKKLGKYKLSSGCCLYIDKLEDVNVTLLKKLIKDSSKYIHDKHC